MTARVDERSPGAVALEETARDPLTSSDLLVPATKAIPERDSARPRHWQGIANSAVPLLVFWAAVVGLQTASGTFQSEFGGHPDEAGHYVTGLMVRDYLLGGHWTQPMQFAEAYYQHYPRVSLGHWPPFFYVVQAAWTIPLGTSRLSVLLLMAAITALTAFTLYRTVLAETDALTAWLVGLLFVALPLVQSYDAVLMSDMLSGLLFFWAALSFGRFLDTGSGRSAAGFGLFAALALLTKGSGVALALVPPLAVLFSRRLALARRGAFWLPALIVLVLCLPWYWLTRKMAATGFTSSSAILDFTIPALGFYSLTLVQAVGWGLSILVAVGLWVRLLGPALRRGMSPSSMSGKWAACGALLVSVWFFAWALPINFEERYLIPALAPLLLFLGAGLWWVARCLPPRTELGKIVVMAVAVVAVFALETFTIPVSACGGFAAAGQQILGRPERTSSNVLLSSDPIGEGMFIAEVASREPRPAPFILRGSKVLCESDWMGHQYTSLCNTPAEMLRELEKLRVDVLVLDTSAPPARYLAHHVLLADTVALYPHRFQPLAKHDVLRQSVGHPGALHVYRFLVSRPQ